MNNIKVSLLTMVPGDKGGVGKSIVAELIAPKLPVIHHSNIRSMHNRKWTEVPPGPRRQGSKRRRN